MLPLPLFPLPCFPFSPLLPLCSRWQLDSVVIVSANAPSPLFPLPCFPFFSLASALFSLAARFCGRYVLYSSFVFCSFYPINHFSALELALRTPLWCGTTCFLVTRMCLPLYTPRRFLVRFSRYEHVGRAFSFSEL